MKKLFTIGICACMALAACDKPQEPVANQVSNDPPPKVEPVAESPAQPREEASPEQAAKPSEKVPVFSVVPLKTIYSDDFASAPTLNGWSNWCPDGEGGSNFAVYDLAVGNADAGSLRLSSVRRGLWQKKLAPVLPGGVYRLSGSFKVKGSGREDFGLGVRSLDGKDKFSDASARFLVENSGSLEPGVWHRKEVLWIVPESGELNGERIGGYDLEFLARELKGVAWFDDLLVEAVGIEAPYYQNFTGGNSGWERYVRPGNESEGGVEYVADGFADAGSLKVILKEGVPGLGAAQVLPRTALSGTDRWTLTAFARAQGAARPLVQVQQLDGEGKAIAQISGDVLEGEGWGPLSATFHLREDAVEVRLVLLNAGTDSVQFDNVLVRPAYGSETEAVASTYPIRVGLYPADPIAAIDDATPTVTVSSGQTSAIGIFLWGEKREGAKTVIDVEMPVWMKLLTAEYAIYGKEPLKWETLPGRDANHVRYRFVDPYPWMSSLQGEGPNNYTNLFLVFDVKAPAETEGELLIQSKLGDDTGEERRLPILVRKTIEPVERTSDFQVGIWSFLWPNVLDDAAREKLLSTYVAAGMNMGQLRDDRAKATLGTFQKLGLTPYVCIVPTPSMRDGYTGSTLLTDENAMRLASGKPYPGQGHVAIGLALKDPAFRAAYKMRLEKLLGGFPKEGYAILDLEYWGLGGTKESCFHPSTIALFREWARIPAGEELTPQRILEKYGEDWSKFRLWGYVEEHRMAREVLREIRPDIKAITYDYVLEKDGKENSFVHTSPMSTLRVDPVVEGHLISTYNREGAAFIDALENSVPYLKRPVWVIPFVMKEMGMLKDKNYNYWQISVPEYQFEVVATAAYGAKGISGYPGQLLDADYLLALHDGVADVHRYADFYFRGTRDNASVELVNPPASVRYTVHRHGDRRLLTLFNGSSEPVTMKWVFAGEGKVAEIAGNGYAQVEL